MPTVLIVEDDADLREIMSIIVGYLGYEVVTAGDGLDGLKMAKSLKPDLIILDLMMPTAGGDLTLGFMRSTDSLKHIPVIVISAHQKADVIAEKLDAQAIIRKPFEMEHLREQIRYYVEEWPNTRQTPHH
ncbi:MAG: response regulator [Anaerolineae bacterium]